MWQALGVRGAAARGLPVTWLAVAILAVAAAAVPAVAQAAPQCTLQLGTQSAQFNQCASINEVGSDFQLFWNSSADGSVTWGMSTASGTGYVAFAFPESPGDMVGAYTFSLQSCKSCPTGKSTRRPPATAGWEIPIACGAEESSPHPHPSSLTLVRSPAGAQLRQYYLAGTTSGSVESTTSPTISGAALAAAVPGGGLAAAFTAPLPEGSSLSGVPLIFAAGAVYSNGYIRRAPWQADMPCWRAGSWSRAQGSDAACICQALGFPAAFSAATAGSTPPMVQAHWIWPPAPCQTLRPTRHPLAPLWR